MSPRTSEPLRRLMRYKTDVVGCVHLKVGTYLGENIKVRKTPGLLLALTSYESNRFFGEHVHQEPGIFLLLGGQHLETGRAFDFVQPPMSTIYHHTERPHATDVGPQGMKGLNISLRNSWLESHGMSKEDIDEGHVRNNPLVHSAALKLYGSFLKPDTSEKQLEELVLEIIACASPVESIRSPKWLKECEEYLRCEFRSSIGLSSAAKKVAVHPVHLASQFRRRYSCSVGDFLQILRVTEALRLVADGLPVGEAAHAAGFSDHAHLTHLCRRKIGTSPRALFAWH